MACFLCPPFTSIPSLSLLLVLTFLVFLHSCKFCNSHTREETQKISVKRLVFSVCPPLSALRPFSSFQLSSSSLSSFSFTSIPGLFFFSVFFTLFIFFFFSIGLFVSQVLIFLPTLAFVSFSCILFLVPILCCLLFSCFSHPVHSSLVSPFPLSLLSSFPPSYLLFFYSFLLPTSPPSFHPSFLFPSTENHRQQSCQEILSFVPQSSYPPPPPISLSLSRSIFQSIFYVFLLLYLCIYLSLSRYLKWLFYPSTSFFIYLSSIYLSIHLSVTRVAQFHLFHPFLEFVNSCTSFTLRVSDRLSAATLRCHEKHHDPLPPLTPQRECCRECCVGMLS